MSVLWLLIRSGEPVAAIAKLVAAVPVPAAFLQLLWPLPPPVFSSLRRRYNIDAILVSRLHQTYMPVMHEQMDEEERRGCSERNHISTLSTGKNDLDSCVPHVQFTDYLSRV